MSKCKCISTADLRNRITIQTLTETADGSGGFSSVWDDTLSAWAKISPVNGYERVQGMQIEATVTHKVVIRYRAGVTTKQRIKFGTRYFAIAGIVNIEERNQYLQIMAVENSMADV